MSRILEPSPAWFEIDPAFYAHGGVCFSQPELNALRDPAGLRALVGPVSPVDQAEEALSLANLGATVTAWGPRPSETEAGQRLAAAAGISLAWEHGDLPALAVRLRGGLDLVYSAWGGIEAAADLHPWAEALATLLAPGGRLMIYDRHPFADVVGLHKGLLVIERSYFGFQSPDHPWTLGEVLSCLAEAGLSLEVLVEFPTSDRYETDIDRLPGLRREQRLRVPAALLITARKPTAPGQIAAPAAGQ
jgi:SAM-dependent methyltransferase